MATIVTRAGKGAPLTHTEVDSNFTNLNTDKAEDSTVVKLTGNQTIDGTKTFSSTISGSISGNAGTVTNGVYTTGDQTIGGTKTFSSTISGSINGNAATATRWQTGRTVSITGDISYTSGSLDGSSNVTGTGTLATVNSNVGTYGSASAIPVVTVNGKGLVTSVSTVAVAGGQYFGTAAVKAIAYNSNSIAENITITTGNNALSVGTITISSGFTVTVSSGCRWVIL